MIVTKENAHEVAKRMSETLKGAVELTIKHPGRKDETMLDENGLDNIEWCGDSKNQELPVKVSRFGLVFAHNRWTRSITYGDSNIEFEEDSVVVLVKNSYNEIITWILKRK